MLKTTLGGSLFLGCALLAGTALVFRPAVPPAPAPVVVAPVVGDDPGAPAAGMPLEFYKGWSARPAGADGVPVSACFAEGTDPDIIAFISEQLFGDGTRYNLTSRWPGSAGTPLTLTWSFAPDGLSIPGSIGDPTSPNDIFATLDAQFAAVGGRAAWIGRFQMVFDRWAQLTGTSYTRVTFGGNDWDDGASWGSPGAAGLRGDIRICAKEIDNALNVLAYNPFPTNGDMHLDHDENWAQGGNTGHRFLRNTAAHEHGHGLGILHVCPLDANFRKLMEPQISTTYDGPRHDDLRAAHRHYGDAHEPNDTDSTATDLGTVDVGPALVFGDIPPLPPPFSSSVPADSSTASTAGPIDLDYYRFTVTGPRNATVSCLPMGTTYDSSSQACGGQPASCCSGNIINSKAMSDLTLEVIDTNGFTVLALANTGGPGTTETLTDVPLPAAGTYFLRVDQIGTSTQSQMYKLSLSITNPCSAPGIAPLAADSTIADSPWTSDTPTASGTGPFTWALTGSPPAGMTIDSGTGVVSWPSPVASMTPYMITLEATNGCGVDTETLTLTVAPGDFTGDGILNELDVPGLVDHLIDLANTNPGAADVNMDGILDALDALEFTDRAI